MDGTDDILWRSLWADDESHLEESKNNRRHLRSAPHLPGISPLRSRPCSNTARDVASARGKPRLRNSSLSKWGNWNRVQPAPLRSRKSRPDATRPVPSHCLRSGRYASARRWIGRPDPVDGQTRPAGSGVSSQLPLCRGAGKVGRHCQSSHPVTDCRVGTVTVPGTFLFGTSRAGGTTEVGDGRCLRPSLNPEDEPSWGSRTGTCEVIKGVTANFARSKRVKTLCPSAAQKQSLTSQGCPVSRPSRT